MNKREYTALIAPLDWGLGHATRCIPLIEKLLIAGFKVIIAAEGDQKILLQSAFPELEIVHLNGYKLKYGKTKFFTLFKIISQIPQILMSINKENRWLARLLKTKNIDIIIADNRFGLHNRHIVSVFITHQLYIKTSLGKAIDAIVQKINYRYINQFDCCLVPDAAATVNLAGELSHPYLKPKIPVLYTGTLSRINKEAIPVTNKLLILLSGPEPQRSIIERILLLALAQHPYPAVILRGLPATTIPMPPPNASITIYNHLPGPQLQNLINASDIIISRAGYSTIMDLLPLGKKCIFIPTPGQAEQEYLAWWLAFNNYACIGLQHNFSLPLLIEKATQLQVPDLSLLKNPDTIGKSIATLLTMLDAKQY